MVQYGMASELEIGRVLFVHANLVKRVLGCVDLSLARTPSLCDWRERLADISRSLHRAHSELHNGNTWGRTLRLRLPSSTSNSNSSERRSPPFLLTADTFANVSPFTGLGISSSTSSASSPVPRSVRTRALLERGLSMRFWSGHFSHGAYVLAVESMWEDELAPGAAWTDEEEQGGNERGAPNEVEARYREGEEEQEAWAQWVERERAAQCSDEGEGDGAPVLHGELHDELVGEDDVVAGARMEVVSWDDDPDLRAFEARYYGIGKGKAGGAGF